MRGTQQQERFVLQARLTEGTHGAPTDDKWYDMEGFSYGTLREMQAAYDKTFAAIDGQGCDYRFKHEQMTLITVTLITEILEPERAEKEES